MDNTAYKAPIADLEVKAEANSYKFQYTNWRARIGRLKYLQMTFFFPLLVFISFILMMVAYLYITNSGPKPVATGSMAWIWGVGIIIILIASLLNWLWLTIQRVHDFGAKGLLAFLVFIPIINLALFLVPGELEENFYGAPPKNESLFVKISGWLGILGLAFFYWVFIVIFMNYLRY